VAEAIPQFPEIIPVPAVLLITAPFLIEIQETLSLFSRGRCLGINRIVRDWSCCISARLGCFTGGECVCPRSITQITESLATLAF
jgi:hypothetical protein